MQTRATEFLTLIIFARRIANNAIIIAKKKLATEPISKVIHSELFVANSLKKVDCWLEEGFFPYKKPLADEIRISSYSLTGSMSV